MRHEKPKIELLSSDNFRDQTYAQMNVKVLRNTMSSVNNISIQMFEKYFRNENRC